MSLNVWIGHLNEMKWNGYITKDRYISKNGYVTRNKELGSETTSPFFARSNLICDSFSDKIFTKSANFM